MRSELQRKYRCVSIKWVASGLQKGYPQKDIVEHTPARVSVSEDTPHHQCVHHAAFLASWKPMCPPGARSSGPLRDGGSRGLCVMALRGGELSTCHVKLSVPLLMKSPKTYKASFAPPSPDDDYCSSSLFGYPALMTTGLFPEHTMLSFSMIPRVRGSISANLGDPLVLGASRDPRFLDRSGAPPGCQSRAAAEAG